MKSPISRKNITVTESPVPHHPDICVLSVKGFIDTNTAPEFERHFQKALAEKKYNLLVDLTHATYVSSAGWGLFVGEIKRIRTQKGDLVLVGMGIEVKEAYNLLQLETILKSYANVDDALHGGFGKPKPAATAAKKGKAKGAQASPAQTPLAMEAAAPTTVMVPRRKRSFLDLFQPWKWFGRN